MIHKTWTSKAIFSWLWFAVLLGCLVWFGFFPSHLWLLEFLHDFSSSVSALMCYFLWFAAGGGSSCSPVLARKHKGDYFQKQIFNCITFWFFSFFVSPPSPLHCLAEFCSSFTIAFVISAELIRCKTEGFWRDFWYCNQKILKLFKAV